MLSLCQAPPILSLRSQPFTELLGGVQNSLQKPYHRTSPEFSVQCVLLQLRVKTHVLAHPIKEIPSLLIAAPSCKSSKDGDYILFFLYTISMLGL